MDHEIDLISDGDGIALLGDPRAIDLFLHSQGMTSKQLDLSRVGASAASRAGGALQAGSAIASQSGRWVKLTEESARLLKHADLMKGATAGTARAIVTQNGKTAHILQIVRTGSVFTTPAVLAGVGGLMSQAAMQHQMDEISDYLATIDAKVDDIIRAQKDAVLADMIGIELVIRDAMDTREQVGHVSDVTWSKVQGTSVTVARTQAYALLRLNGLAEKVERAGSLAEVADSVKVVESTVKEWLAVIARCVQLAEAISVLELDRVLDSSPEDLEQHREGLAIARSNRAQVITKSTHALLNRMGLSAADANAKVLLHPSNARSVVASSNRVFDSVGEFHTRLGLDAETEELEARRWRDAATDVKDRVVETGAAGAETAARVATRAFGRAQESSAGLARGLAARIRERRQGDDESD